MSLQGFYTTKGLALAAKLAAGTGLTITRVTAGSGETAASAAALAQERQTLTVGEAAVSGQSAVLPQKEFMLLYKMVSFPGRIFTRQQLMDEIWGYDSDTDTHTVDVHIGRLRERFRGNTDFRIVTMRGVGYKVVKQ